MSDRVYAGAPQPPLKVRTSIARKLNSRLVLRLFGLFLSLDFVLLLITGVCIAAYADQKAAAAVGLLGQSGLPAGLPDGWQSASGVDISVLYGPPADSSEGRQPSQAPAAEPAETEPRKLPGIKVPMPFSYLLPPVTREARRDVVLTSEKGAPFRDRIEKVDYIVYYPLGGSVYRIDVGLKPILRLVYISAAVLIVWELLTIAVRAVRDRRMVRSTLDPISALTRAAQDLNNVTRSLDPDKMAALAGRLEGIDAARLDTRIPVDETQEELRNLARAINGMLDRINDSYRAQVRFVSDASHELRTPISVIQGYANLLDRWGKKDEKTLQESITAIKEEAAGMKELVEQLLFLARGDNNTILLQPETFSLKELAEEVAGETRMIDAAHEYFTELTDVSVSADRALIKQALRILVDNAVKYTDSGGRITLVTAADGATATLAVRDNGIGIAPDKIPRIFDRFYRADESRARATGGAGLGLSIATWITSRHGGHMEVTSREGLGTKIAIVLPKGQSIVAAPLPEPV